MSCQVVGRLGWQGEHHFFPLLENRLDLMSVAQLRASYSIVDHRERQIAPHSLAFDLVAQKLVFFLLHGLFVN